MSLLKDFAHKQIPLQDVLSATHNFSDENFIREGGFGKIYKGQLLHSGETIRIVARRLDPKYGQGDTEFLTEISMLSSLQHKNVISFIGYCDEDEEKIIVNKYEANSSLDKYLSDPTLTWTQRLRICVGVARALSYIYYDKGRVFSVIHRNVKSSKIFLDHNWEPKLSGFELSVTSPAGGRQRVQLTEVISGTYGYVDPTYKTTGGVSHKSDMFSLGVVLFEVLCGRRAFIPDKNDQERSSLMFTMNRLDPNFDTPKGELLSKLAKSHYEVKQLDDLIDLDLREQMEDESYQLFIDTAYTCLKDERAQRPDIDQVVHRLERALKLQSEYDNNKHRKVVAAEETISTIQYPSWMVITN